MPGPASNIDILEEVRQKNRLRRHTQKSQKISKKYHRHIGAITNNLDETLCAQILFADIDFDFWHSEKNALSKIAGVLHVTGSKMSQMFPKQPLSAICLFLQN